MYLIPHLKFFLGTRFAAHRQFRTKSHRDALIQAPAWGTTWGLTGSFLILYWIRSITKSELPSNDQVYEGREAGTARHENLSLTHFLLNGAEALQMAVLQ